MKCLFQHIYNDYYFIQHNYPDNHSGASGTSNLNLTIRSIAHQKKSADHWQQANILNDVSFDRLT